MPFVFYFYKKKSSRITIKVSNNLDPDQDQHFVRLDLGPNCLQRYQQMILYSTASLKWTQIAMTVAQKINLCLSPALILKSNRKSDGTRHLNSYCISREVIQSVNKINNFVVLSL